MTADPTAILASFPDGYGTSTHESLDWDQVAAQIAASPNYWVATITNENRPHLRPVDGVFVDTTLAVGGSPTTRWVRNLTERPQVSVSLPDAEHAVILEGDMRLVTDPDDLLAPRISAANASKYPQHYQGGQQGFRPYWALTLHRVYAWQLTGFPDRATRFDFP